MRFLKRSRALVALLALLAFLSTGAILGALDKDLNLSDLNNAATALVNLGLTATAAEINAMADGTDTLDFDSFADAMSLDADLSIAAATGEEITINAAAQVGIDEILALIVDQADDADATDVLQAIRIELGSESGDANDTIRGIVMTVEEGTANTIIDAAISIDNEETTASTLTDGILITSSGVAAGVTDAVDASAANIVNAINIGANLIAGTDDTLSVGATDDTVILDSNDSGGTYTCTDADANAACTFAGGGTGATNLGSGTSTAVTIAADGTTDGDLVLPLTSVGAGEVVADAIDGTQLADTLVLDATLGITSGAAEGVAMTHAMTNDTTETGFLITVTASDTGSGTTEQYGLYVDNAASTEGLDALLVLDNSDADDAVTDGLLLIAAAGTVVDGLDVSDAEITNAINVGANLIMGSDDSLSVGATDDTVILDSNDSAGSYICTDADANADCSFAAGGTGIATLGAAANASVALVSDDTGGAEFAMMENGIAADDIAVVTDHIIFCGQNAENGTIFFGPATAPFKGAATAYVLDDAQCDALDNATEATADAPLFSANLTFKIMGFWCESDATLGAAETIDFTARTAEADVATTDGAATTITCQIAEGESFCSATEGSTTDIAAGATVAMEVIQSSDNGDGDDSWCRMAIGVK